MHWHNLKIQYKNNHLAQALLLVGGPCSDLISSVRYFIAWTACQIQQLETLASQPCGNCIQCRMILDDHHPDIHWIRAEKNVILVDQIRRVHLNIFEKPLSLEKKFIIIDSAESLNLAAANALLKILEEPPEHVQFFLISPQIITLPKTLLSRCPRYHFSSPDIKEEGKNAIDLSLETESPHCASLILSLLKMKKKKIHPLELAEQWKNQDIKELLSLWYLINAQIILIKMHHHHSLDGPINELAQVIDLRGVFYHMEKISALKRKIIHNIPINIHLALDDLLINFCIAPSTNF